MALVTGGTAGIGKEAALRLAQAGAHVIIVGRDAERGQRAVDEIQVGVPGSDIRYWQHDLALMKSVQALAATVRAEALRLDMIVHSAGVMLPRRELTAEGLETVFAVQYLARFYLSNLLADHLPEHARILSVSAGGTIPIHLNFNNLNGEKFYNGVYALIHESVANDLFALRFMAEHPAIRFYNYGPFYVRSGLFTEMGLLFKLATATIGRLVATTPQVAATDIIGLLSSDSGSGMYSRRLKLVKPNRYRSDKAVQDRLWMVSEQMVADALKR